MSVPTSLNNALSLATSFADIRDAILVVTGGLAFVVVLLKGQEMALTAIRGEGGEFHGDDDSGYWDNGILDADCITMSPEYFLSVDEAQVQAEIDNTGEGSW